MLFKDLLTVDGRFTDWWLTPAPYFFPDYLFYGFGYFVGASALQRMALASLAQASALFLFSWALCAQIRRANALPSAVVFTTIVCCLAATPDRPFVYALIVSYHAGAFLSGLLLLALYLASMHREQPSGGLLAAIAALTFVSALSDAIFIMQALAPLCAVIAVRAVFLRKEMARAIALAAALGLSLALAVYVYKKFFLSPIGPPAHLGFSRIRENYESLLGIFSYQIDVLTALAPLYIGFYVLLPVLAVRTVFRLTRGVAPSELQALALFIVASLAICVGAPLLVTNLSYDLRHFMPIFLWPILFLACLLGRLSVAAATRVGLVAGLAGLVLLLNLALKFPVADLGGDDYPADVACIDGALGPSAAAPHGLIHGAAGYWDAKRVLAFSRRRLTLAQYNSELVRFPWITSRRYFADRYDFAIVSNEEALDLMLGKREVIEQAGTPLSVVDCGARSVLIYGERGLKLEN